MVVEEIVNERRVATGADILRHVDDSSAVSSKLLRKTPSQPSGPTGGCDSICQEAVDTMRKPRQHCHTVERILTEYLSDLTVLGGS